MKNLETTVENSSFSRSKVSIIIPFHGEHDKVVRCLESIILVTRSNPYQICLVDDASPSEIFFKEMMNSWFAKVPEQYQYLKVEPQVIGVRSEERLGFGGALNLGLQKTKQPWVLFMHSDVVVSNPQWLIELGRMILEYKDMGIKMVSARTDNPGDGCSALMAKKDEIGKDLALSDEEWLPLYCSLFHRELFNHIGGPMKAYPYVGYEDRELAARMKKAGFKQGICGKSWVHHDGGGTINNLMEQIHKEERVLGKPIRKVKDIVAENKLRYERDVKLLAK
jgi:GT2 family glycosyltransferase